MNALQATTIINKIQRHWPDEPLTLDELPEFLEVLGETHETYALRALNLIKDRHRPTVQELRDAIADAVAESRGVERADTTDHGEIATRRAAEARAFLARGKETR